MKLIDKDGQSSLWHEVSRDSKSVLLFRLDGEPEYMRVPLSRLKNYE